MRQLLKNFFSVIVLLFVGISAYAQMTTATLGGQITDEEKQPIVGAAVVATHEPSGTVYGAVTNASGHYTIMGMRSGGPYKVEISCLAYQSAIITDITLSLGEDYKISRTLKEDKEMLAAAVVVSSNMSSFTDEKTGASTNVSNSQLMNLPSVNRSIVDVAKLSPYANGMSFAGSDGRSTNFTVDGANFNNNFGLSANLPGGGNPISLDAIEEVQLVVAPYDVRQSNFVGGGINAVTKSGTNEFHASAYAYYTSQDLRGNTLYGEELGDRPFSYNLTTGVTIGGPIVKDKLFFFVNWEMLKSPKQAIEYKADGESMALLSQVKDKLMNDYGYDPGSYTDYPGGIDNMKVLARIDWNINDKNKLSIRGNYTTNSEWNEPNGNSCDDKFRNRSFNRSSAISFPFSGNMYNMRNNVLSFSAELNSQISNMVHNNFIATFSKLDDVRTTPNNAIFPHIDIMRGYDDAVKNGNFTPFTSLGTELFSYNNAVKNNVISVKDNVTIHAGKHKITAGLSWEYQQALNSYMRNGAGYYRFASVEDFLNNATPLSACVTYGYDGEANPRGEVRYHQASIYAQDEWSISPKFKLTYGIRADGLFFDNSNLVANPAIDAYQMGDRTVSSGQWAKPSVQVSPRVGFNWDVFGDNSLKFRGGIGLFQGRLPLVFFTNMPQNTATVQYQGGVSATNKNGVPVWTADQKNTLNSLYQGGKLVTDVNQMAQIMGFPSSRPAGGSLPSSFCGIDPNFKMPQIMKVSLALDYQLPVNFPFTITAEGMFNKTIYGVRLVDWNINQDALTKSFPGSDNRIDYSACGNYKFGESTAYVLTNTNEGYGYTANVTINMTPFKNFNVMAAYTRTDSFEISGMPGSNASSAYSGLYSVNGPDLANLQRSRYVIPDRVMVNLGYRIPTAGIKMNLHYTTHTAGTYTYTYSNDMNGDGISADIIYIPASKDDINFKTAADQEAFWSYVNQDPYLKNHKGQYAGAYGLEAPWVHLLDARIAKDFKFMTGKKQHNFELSMSFNNILNMINSYWGVSKWNCYQTSYELDNLSPLKFEGKNSAGEPVYSMVKAGSNVPTETFPHGQYNKNTSQCWSILLGLKYSF